MSWFNTLAKMQLADKHDELVSNLTWCEGRLQDTVGLEEHLQGCKTVYHAAAVVSFARRDKQKLYTSNVQGTANLLNVCLGMEEKPDVCHISSTASVGSVENMMVDESYAYSTETTSSYYSHTKYLAELEAFRAREEGLNVAIINPCIVLGFGNWHKGPSKFFKNGKKGFPYYTPGSNAFVDARDVAEAAFQLLEKKVFSERYLCTGWNLKYEEVFRTISNEFGSKPPRIKVKKWMSEIAWRLASIPGALTGNQLITKDSARAGMKLRSFSSEKLKEKTGFEFRDFNTSIAETCSRYKTFLKSQS